MLTQAADAHINGAVEGRAVLVEHMVEQKVPAQRPVGAPIVARFEQSAAWRAAALRGMQEPQTGLGFLKDQGAWYTPFNQPNLAGRYDIRGLHAGQNKD